jgi:hypothetical protein
MDTRAIRLVFDEIAKIPMPADRTKKLLLVGFSDYYGQRYTWAPKWADLLQLVRDSLITETLNNRPLKTKQFVRAIGGMPAIRELLMKEKQTK